MAKLTPNQVGAVERGISALLSAVDFRGSAEDKPDQRIAQILVDNEMELRALMAFAQSRLAKKFFKQWDFVE